MKITKNNLLIASVIGIVTLAVYGITKVIKHTSEELDFPLDYGNDERLRDFIGK